MRIGFGYDVHRLSRGRRFVLGGVAIPFEMGLLGYSDADVLCHAISDALLGAAALGDIGRHFPDHNPVYKNADSLDLLSKCTDMIEQHGFAAVNIDATVVLQQPKIAPYIEKMRENLGKATRLAIASVSVKATTTEGLDSCGRGEGVAAYAVVLLQ